MNKVFFGKMNIPEQTNSKIYKTSDRKYFGNIQIGDYAFIKLEKESKDKAIIKRLWRLREIKQEDGTYTASFDEIISFDQISLRDFQALDLFVLNLNLLNKTERPNKRLSFIELTLTNEASFENLIKSPDSFSSYIKETAHLRRIVKVNSKDEVQADSINVQLYKESGIWHLADSSFIGSDLKASFDPQKFDLFDKNGKKARNTDKKKMYDFLQGKDIDVPMVGLYDLFCGKTEAAVSSSNKRRSKIKRPDFFNYCKANGVSTTPDQYESEISKLEKTYSIDIDEQYDLDRCESIKARIHEEAKGVPVDKRKTFNNKISYINKFVEYKDSFKPSSEISKNLSSYDYTHESFSGINKVFYGTPGCGKSFYVENTVLTQEGINSDSVFRTTFFYDYSNTDFVGQVLPRVKEDGSVSYEFIPGPFTLALRHAIDNSDKKVALVIEELNRGNAPSIFGDIFQLLDRINGTSRYEMLNVNIRDYLKKEGTLKNTIYELEYIKIPSNLYIFATMNTSDQNVFTLDTAFKRRWKFEKRTNEFLTEDTIGNKFVPGLLNVTWQTFVETINKHIIDYSSSLSAEDKQLGKYFVDEELLLDNYKNYSVEILEGFAYKVFEYLWTDVAKYNRKDWFVDEVKTLDELINRYKKHKSIFTSQLESLKLYNPDEE